MLDELFFREKANKTSLNYIIFSFALTLIAFITSLIIFQRNASVATILITAILLMPAVVRLFREEELIVRKEGLKHIIKNHRYIFNIFLMIFLGTFLAFFFAQLVSINKPEFFSAAFDYQIRFIETNRDLTFFYTDQIMQGSSLISEFSTLTSILYANLLLVLVAFMLSLFYGAGGIFLLVIASSVLSTMILYALKSSAFFLPFTVLFSLLFILLLIPLILSSVAGGILSNAFMSEKVRKHYFWNVVKDASTLFLFSVLASVLLVGIWALALGI
jgi:hypothetical protein